MKEQQDLQRTLPLSFSWFLDLCTSRNLCNNWRLFTNTWAKNIDFITVTGQVIQIEEIGIVSIPLADNITIKFQNIVLAPGCNSNLILLG